MIINFMDEYGQPMAQFPGDYFGAALPTTGSLIVMGGQELFVHTIEWHIETKMIYIVLVDSLPTIKPPITLGTKTNTTESAAMKDASRALKEIDQLRSEVSNIRDRTRHQTSKKSDN